MFTRLSDLRSKLEHMKGSFEGTASEVHNFVLGQEVVQAKAKDNHNKHNNNNINNNKIKL